MKMPKFLTFSAKNVMLRSAKSWLKLRDYHFETVRECTVPHTTLHAIHCIPERVHDGEATKHREKVLAQIVVFEVILRF